jgi:hypothetical protein
VRGSAERKGGRTTHPIDGEDLAFSRVSITARGAAKLKEIEKLVALPGRRGFDPAGCFSSKETYTLAALLEKSNDHLASTPWRSVARERE